ncbi:MAG: branched-chain amino acid transaminase [Myxococcota bacterium]
MEKVKWIWHDGKLVAWENARVHLMTHSLHYGYAAFEGIRCYAQKSGGAAIFRLDAHLQRLFHTAHIAAFEIPFTLEELHEASRQLVRENDLQGGCYLRPLAYMGEGEMGIAAIDNPVSVAIMAWKWGAYLGEEGIRNGIRAMISSYRRSRSDVLPAKGKITGQYVGSILAKREALGAGYHEAIVLDTQGYVAEGTGENIFVVADGKVRTPAIGQAILAGVTRDSIITLLRDEGYTVEEALIGRDELYCADEVFLTGTAAEVTPVREVDNRKIGTGRPGELTAMIQKRYHQLVTGELGRYRDMLTMV